jgi:hypothetical protein
MLRRLFALVVLLLGMLLPATASADATIYFEPRADGGWRISTPAEDYVAVPLGGGAVWIGSEREYNRSLVDAWATEHGFRADTAHPNTFYLKATKRAFLPSVTVDGVTTLVDASDGQVDVNWTLSKPIQVAMYLLDERTRKLYRPIAVDTQGSIHDETFRVPRAALRNRMMMFFFASKSEVAAVEVRSLAHEAYSILADAQRTAPSAKDRRQMAALRRLDPSIAKQ